MEDLLPLVGQALKMVSKNGALSLVSDQLCWGEIWIRRGRVCRNGDFRDAVRIWACKVFKLYPITNA